MKVYSPQEVSAGDGKEGRQALVAVDGKVYDFSLSKRWISGTHMNRHHAGMDLSKDIRSAPHGADIVSRFEVVGLYQGIVGQVHTGYRRTVETFLDRYPFFRRHPHPAVIHFPLAFLLAAPFMEIGAIITGSARTEWASFCLLVTGVLSVPVALLTGYFTWWVNYDAVDSTMIRTKRRLAWSVLVLGSACCIVGVHIISDPLSRQGTDLVSASYVLALLALGAIVSFVGFLGGKLAFPYE